MPAGLRLTAALLSLASLLALPSAAAAQGAGGRKPAAKPAATPTAKPSTKPPVAGRELPMLDTTPAQPPMPKNVATDSARRASGASVASDSTAPRDSTAAAAAPPPVDCDALVRRFTAKPDTPADQAPSVVLWSAPAALPSDIEQGSIDAAFIVDEFGAPELSTLALSRTHDATYRQRVAEALTRMSFRPARLKGCAIPARAYVSFPTR
jgi:hypothetical protein